MSKRKTVGSFIGIIGIAMTAYWFLWALLSTDATINNRTQALWQPGIALWASGIALILAGAYVLYGDKL